MYFLAHVDIEYESYLKRSIMPIDKLLTGTTTALVQSGTGSNENEGVVQTRLSFVPSIN